MHVDLFHNLFETSTLAFSAISSGETLCFVIDQQVHPDALARLYGVGEPIVIEPLYLGTEFATISEGPLWLQARWGSALANCAMRLCEDRFAGIAIRAADPAQALAHARWLLRVNDGSGGQSLLSYHKPSLWAALSLTSGSSRMSLLGPWQSVYSPAASRFQDDQQRWLGWSGNPNTDRLSQPSVFTLPENISHNQRQIDWLYWLDEYFADYAEPNRAQVPNLIANLDLLVNSEIIEGAHLLKLAALTAEMRFDGQPQIMAILQSKDYAFIKVSRLLELELTPA